MAIRYPEILDLSRTGVPVSWRAKDAILYALGVGLGDAPVDGPETAFVYEKGVKVTPTLATVALYRANAGDLGLNYARMLHGEQSIAVLRPLTADADLLADGRVVSVHDKGRDKGCVVVTEITLRDANDGETVCVLTSTIFARGDGGFGGPNHPPPAPHPIPDRAPDRSIDIATNTNQALLFRLLGDLNPLHADPAAARAAGFERPILHGLCTYGVTCRAVLQAYANFDPARIRSHAARFAAPAYPGETLTIDLWTDDDVISFEARVRARGVKIIANGKSVLTPPPTQGSLS
jgi:acyl dehydratase